MGVSLHAVDSVANPCATGVILAIDYGRKRLGLALSDAEGLSSRPYATWTRVNRRRDLARLRELVRLENIRRIVIGLPLHLDGAPSEMSGEVKGFAERVRKALGLPVELMDERLSSWEAHEMVSANRKTFRTRSNSSDGNNGRKKMNVDHVAAAIILRDYLQRPRTGSRD